MAQQNELRVFISSTFRDLQEEREHLVKKIFPEIRSLCRARGVTFTEVDLRWGLTEEQAALGTVIRTCLEEVDKCRPYFIGMLGDRYGWVPELHELLMDPDLLAKYPWIEDVAIDGASVTEMEFIHGVFDAPQVDGEYAFFYHRQSDISGADDPERLAALISRARATGRPFREFAGTDELGRQVHDDLVVMIDRYWPESEAPSALELERRSHAAFSASRTRAYIPNPEHLRRFSAWVGDGALPLVVSGASGLGKSSLVAYLVETYRRKNPKAFIIEHYVGASQSSGTAVAVMRHIIEEIRERFGIDEELPSRPEELERSFPNWLFRAEHHAAQTSTPLLVVIDAVNQLDESGQHLAWLPKTIPSGVKLLISTTPGEAGERLEERRWESLEVRPLEDERVRQSIVVRYLGEFHKGIAPEQLRQVASDTKASSPLYLRVVAEELRLHGEHETVAAMISRYAQAENILQVFDLVLERIERDYGDEQVRTVLELIWASRSGLSETELLELTGASRLELSRLLFALDYHLSRRDGHLGFFHDYLRRAVERRYLLDVDRRNQIRLELARYFEGLPLTRRTALELLWQYGSDENGEASPERDAHLASTLARTDLLLKFYLDETQFEMLALWARLAGRGYNAAEEYRRSLAASEQTSSATHGEALLAIALMLSHMDRGDAARNVYEELVAWSRDHDEPSREARGYFLLGESRVFVGEYDRAMEYYRETLRIASEIGDRILEANILGNIGLVHAAQGRYPEALEHYDRMLAISEELGDQRGIGIAFGNIGAAHQQQGRHAEALECYRRLLAIGRERGDRSGISLATGNIGIVHYQQERYAEALECFGRQLEINEELGRRSNVSTAICNMGVVYIRQGRYAEALECYSRCLPIAEEQSDRYGISVILGSIGNIHAHRGEFQEAVEYYDRQRSICEDMGDPRGMSIAIGNIGSQHAEQRQYQQALENYSRAADEHRAIGYRYGLTYWLEGIARVLVMLTSDPDAAPPDQMPEYLQKYLEGATAETWRTLALSVARTHAEECIAISDDLAKPDTRLLGSITLARVEAAEGHPGRALEQLDAMLSDATDETSRADLHYWLWKLAAESGVRSAASKDTIDHHAEALRLYTGVYAANAKYIYKQRIEDLTTS